jgi:geranylgeranyl diphosphate synthase, type I
MPTTFLSFISSYQQKLINEIPKQIIKYQQSIPIGDTIINSYLSKLQEFSLSGKILRGSFVLYSYDLHGGKENNHVLTIASAIEIIHSSILIHDDILDHAQFRRGKPSVHQFYNKKGTHKKVKDFSYGINMGIAGGDIGYFIGISLISSALDIHPQKNEIISFVTEEFLQVLMTQMVEYDWSTTHYEPKAHEILDIYRYKTANYSFVLPFLLGGKLAGIPKIVLPILAAYTESLGMIFQLQDDWLDIFGLKDTIGKEVGTDIKDNKKTFYRYLLFQESTPKEKNILKNIFGNTEINFHDYDIIFEISKKNGIVGKYKKFLLSYVKEAKKALEVLPYSNLHKQVLSDLIEYSVTRTA